MVYLYGASGHGKVILDILIGNKEKIGGFFDDSPEKFIGGFWPVPFPGKFSIDTDSMIISIGNNSTRKILASKFNCSFARAIHIQSILSPSVQIGWGTVVMGGALINADTQVGNHVIINSHASVDHDCILGDYVHIAPGSVLCGGVHIGEGTLIGARSVILPNLKIGKNVIIGAGSVVVDHVPDGLTLMGNPAKIKAYANEN